MICCMNKKTHSPKLLQKCCFTNTIAGSLANDFYLVSLQEALDLQIYANFTANQVEGLLPKIGGDARLC